MSASPGGPAGVRSWCQWTRRLSARRVVPRDAPRRHCRGSRSGEEFVISPKAIALSGGTGFLGCHLLPRLLSQGHSVIALVRGTPQQATQRLERALEFAGARQAAASLGTDRLRVLRADLEQPGLGLGAQELRRLAGETDEVWHCAAATDLRASLRSVSGANVDGTRHMLELAAAPGRERRFVHVSTAFVAGDRRDGVVREDDLDDSHGFVTPYEESKYRAERLVRSWARDGRRALVLRPSTLLTDRPPSPRGPRAPHSALRWALSRLAALGPRHAAERFAAAPDAQGRVRLRLPGRTDGLINIAPVEYAADAAVRLAGEDSGPGTVTRHVVHPVDTPLTKWIDAIAAQAPWARVEIAEEWSPVNDLERHLVGLNPGGLRYGYHRRSYERTALDLLEARDGVPAQPPLDAAYLRAALGYPARRPRVAGDRDR
ncbi:SDR family oxidoreductase [Streptomyces abyssomicinicus]|uniref:SDR family oxidoreductase n=1 Tax=Streptomyces abyssomicinicus TaxID=574929 RepID=UPI0013DF92D9|nr:SDR family oxidoreductase [Streptomyces abyssomicinicus]